MNQGGTREVSDDNGAWETECGNMFEVTDGTPNENDMKFCPYCGKTLVEFVKVDIDGKRRVERQAAK